MTVLHRGSAGNGAPNVPARYIKEIQASLCLADSINNTLEGSNRGRSNNAMAAYIVPFLFFFAFEYFSPFPEALLQKNRVDNKTKVTRTQTKL